MRKKILTVGLIACAIAVTAYAAPGTLSSIGDGAKTEVAGFLKSLRWILALIGVVIPFASMGYAWNKISEKEESSSGQSSEPKLMKAAKVAGAGFAGFAVMYIIYGTLSVALLGNSFTSGWSIIVSDFWTGVFQ